MASVVHYTPFDRKRLTYLLIVSPGQGPRFNACAHRYEEAR